jgi:hypothetical protein
MGATVSWSDWYSLKPSWDHDHCEFCWATFMSPNYPPEQRPWREAHPEVLTAGYTVARLESSRLPLEGRKGSGRLVRGPLSRDPPLRGLVHV